jgi:hypothetical protein
MNAKPKAALITTIVAALAIAGALAGLALSASASTGLLASTSATNTATSTNAITSSIPTQQGGPGEHGGFGMPGPYHQSEVNLTDGQTITITSTSGSYYSLATNSVNGTASGTFTFTVTGKLSTGYILSISSGSISVNGVTYTVSSGTAQMTLSADGISGQGTTSSSGVFAIQAQAHGSFVGSSARVTLDFSNGTTEYAVFLSGTA